MSYHEEKPTDYREAARIRAQRSRDRARSRKRLARKAADDAVVESALCTALVDLGDESHPNFAHRKALVQDVLSRAVNIVFEAGIADGREKVINRLTDLRAAAMLDGGR